MSEFNIERARDYLQEHVRHGWDTSTELEAMLAAALGELEQTRIAIHALARMVNNEWPDTIPNSARIWGNATDEEVAALEAVVGGREYPVIM